MLPLSGGPLVHRSVMIYAVMLVFSAFGCGYVAYAGAKRRQAEAEVRNHRDYLKQLVDQRTLELTNLNRQLQTDINEREKVERELRESEEKYRSMMEAMDDAAYICSDDFHVTYMNSAMVKRTGRNAVGEPCSQVIHELEEQCPWCVHQRVMNGEHVKTEVVSPKDQRTYQVSNSPIFHQDGSVSKLTIFRDNTEVKAIEAQLQQAQKLESVGRLAGGVAHDYNNALSVIMGFAELTLNSMPPNNPLTTNLNEIIKAARTATDITRQLLAFARKQDITPRVLDLNDNVDQMLKMLRRLIGEDIDLVWMPGADLWPVMMDPSQVSQILANLCVNSRDAIKGVGKITIETKNTSFEEVRSTAHVDARPGDYVRLVVTDDGCGMKKEIVENIFEPFFTTKTVDKGTGLGLSTVYGIVRQNDGFINVHSEPGHGTAFSIYLPRHSGQPVRSKERKRTDMPVGKGETILLVEDDLPFLRLTRKILEILGYTLLTASTPTEALKLAEAHAGSIHLLIADVIMPEMDGQELAQRMEAFCPQMRHMFMSGYTADVIRHRGKLDEGVRLLYKPFAMKDLAEAVQVVLSDEK